MSHNRDLKFVTSVVQRAISCLFNTFLISMWLPDPDLARQSITRDIIIKLTLNGDFLVCLVPVRLLLSVPRERLVQRARLYFVSRSYWLTRKFKLVTIG